MRVDISSYGKLSFIFVVSTRYVIVGGLFEFKACMKCFWNLTNVSVVHRDEKDFCFCVVIPFGDFSQGILDFPVINTKVDFKRGAFWSRGLFHNLVDVVSNKQYIILTNHSSLLEKFINIDVPS